MIFNHEYLQKIFYQHRGMNKQIQKWRCNILRLRSHVHNTVIWLSDHRLFQTYTIISIWRVIIMVFVIHDLDHGKIKKSIFMFYLLISNRFNASSSNRNIPRNNYNDIR